MFTEPRNIVHGVERSAAIGRAARPATPVVGLGATPAGTRSRRSPSRGRRRPAAMAWNAVNDERPGARLSPILAVSTATSRPEMGGVHRHRPGACRGPARRTSSIDVAAVLQSRRRRGVHPRRRRHPHHRRPLPADDRRRRAIAQLHAELAPASSSTCNEYSGWRARSPPSSAASSASTHAQDATTANLAPFVAMQGQGSRSRCSCSSPPCGASASASTGTRRSRPTPPTGRFPWAASGCRSAQRERPAQRGEPAHRIAAGGLGRVKSSGACRRTWWPWTSVLINAAKHADDLAEAAPARVDCVARLPGPGHRRGGADAERIRLRDDRPVVRRISPLAGSSIA